MIILKITLQGKLLSSTIGLDAEEISNYLKNFISKTRVKVIIFV